MGPVRILLVEDNSDHELLALRALRKNSIANDVVVARDGAEALEYLYRRGAYGSREGGTRRWCCWI